MAKKSVLLKTVLEVAGLIVLVFLVGVAVLFWRFSQGPINLAVFKPRLEAYLGQLLGDREVNIASFTLEWAKDRRRIEALAREITAPETQEQGRIEIGKALLKLEAPALLRFRVKPLSLHMESGLIRLRAADSSGDETETEQDFFEQFRQNLDNLTLRQFSLTGFVLERVDGASNTPLWAIRNIDAHSDFDGRKFSLSLDGEFVSKNHDTELPGKIVLSARADLAESKFRLGLQGDNLSGVQAHFFPHLPVFFTGALEAQAELVAKPGEPHQPAMIELSGSGGDFMLKKTGATYPVKAFDGKISYAAGQVTIPAINIDSAAIGGRLSGQVNTGSATNIGMDLRVDDLRVNIPNWFEQALAIKLLRVDGEFDTEKMLLSANNFTLADQDTSFSGSAEITFAGDRSKCNAEQYNCFGLKLSTKSTGKLVRDNLLRYWPLPIAPEGRNWVRDFAPLGTMYDIRVETNADFGDFGLLPLPDKVLDLYFTLEGTSVLTMPDLPPASSLAGTGHLRGNSLSFQIKRGAFGEWEIYEGQLDIEKLYPPTGQGQLACRGRGQLADILRILENSEIGGGTSSFLDTDRVMGQGDLRIELSFPLYEVENPILPYTMEGSFSDVFVPDLMGEFGLRDASMSVVGDTYNYEIEGSGIFADMPVDFTWTEKIIEYPLVTRSRIKVSGVADEDALNGFGIPVRGFVAGPTLFEFSGQGAGRSMDTMLLQLDLSGVTMKIDDIGWSKGVGAAARARLHYGGSIGKGGMGVLDINAGDLTLYGEAEIDAEGKLLRGNIERLDIADKFAGSGTVRYIDPNIYAVNFVGDRFDITPFIEKIKAGGWTKESRNQARKRDSSRFLIGIDVKDMALLHGQHLNDAKFYVELGANRVEEAFLSGTIGEENVSFDLSLGKEGTASVLQLDSADASFLLRALFGNETLTGGQMTASAVLQANNDLSANINIKDAVLKNAPILVKVLTLASLPALLDNLGKKGLLFSEINLPIERKNGTLLVPGARASGPGLGLTAVGWLSPVSGRVSMDGVIVPSFGINSFLGGIPIIGNLFVSRRGEGIFAVVYSIRGDLQNVEVKINPVSILAPGILRRVFENPSTLPGASDLAPTKPQPKAATQLVPQRDTKSPLEAPGLKPGHIR